MEQRIKQQLGCVIDIGHQLMLQNIGKLSIWTRLTHCREAEVIDITLLEAIENEEPGKSGITVYSFDSWEEMEAKMEYMKNLVIKYGGIGDVYADTEENVQ